MSEPKYKRHVEYAKSHPDCKASQAFLGAAGIYSNGAEHCALAMVEATADELEKVMSKRLPLHKIDKAKPGDHIVFPAPPTTQPTTDAGKLAILDRWPRHLVWERDQHKNLGGSIHEDDDHRVYATILAQACCQEHREPIWDHEQSRADAEAFARNLTHRYNTQPGLVRMLERVTGALSHCANVVGDPMYASVKKDYRAELRDLCMEARELLPAKEKS